jgi:hypothetical protein
MGVVARGLINPYIPLCGDQFEKAREIHELRFLPAARPGGFGDSLHNGNVSADLASPCANARLHCGLMCANVDFYCISSKHLKCLS